MVFPQATMGMLYLRDIRSQARYNTFNTDASLGNTRLFFTTLPRLIFNDAIGIGRVDCSSDLWRIREQRSQTIPIFAPIFIDITYNPFPVVP